MYFFVGYGAPLLQRSEPIFLLLTEDGFILAFEESRTVLQLEV